MGKLVRDRIPEIIRAEGRSAATRHLDDDAYLQSRALRLQYRRHLPGLADRSGGG